MPTLRTDDAARRLDFPIGPPLLRAPVPVWGVFSVVAVVGWVAGALLVAHLALGSGAILLAALVPLGPATVLALISKKWINRVTPLMYHLRTLGYEVSAPRPETDTAVTYETAISPHLFVVRSTL